MPNAVTRALTRVRTRPRMLNSLVIASITACTALVSQRWTGLDTPDSSFYASLSIFGDDVTDRAPIDSYYWTRLGYIAPVRALTNVLGIWPGFTVYRLLLLLVIVAATYLTLRRFTRVATAAALTALVSLNTVLLSYLGNTYLTGTVMAGTVALIALGLRDSRRSAVLSGVLLGWLLMVNPVGFLLAGVIWVTLRISARTSIAHFALAALGAVASFGCFLALGLVMFPGMNWFATFSATQGMKLSDFASKTPVWLGDISLLVPVAILIISLAIWFTKRASRPAQLALMVSSSSIAFMLVFSPLMGGIALEAPMYQSMLWPPALLALALATTAIIGDARWARSTYLVAAVGIIAVVLAGHLSPGLGLPVGWLIAVAIIVAFVYSSSKATIGALVGVALVLVGAQLLQNSRGPLGLYYLSPYSWAFNANPISDKIHTAVNTEEWLLAQTSSTDTILDWVQGDWVGGDRELYVVAAMQLWGENRVTLEPTLTPDDITRLQAIRPSVLAMYGQTMDGVLAFWGSIPAANRPTAPLCYDFTWPTTLVKEGHACLTHLSW